MGLCILNRCSAAGAGMRMLIYAYFTLFSLFVLALEVGIFVKYHKPGGAA